MDKIPKAEWNITLFLETNLCLPTYNRPGKRGFAFRFLHLRCADFSLTCCRFMDLIS